MTCRREQRTTKRYIKVRGSHTRRNLGSSRRQCPSRSPCHRITLSHSFPKPQPPASCTGLVAEFPRLPTPRGLELEPRALGGWRLDGDPSVGWFTFVENDHLIFFKMSWTKGSLTSLGGTMALLRGKGAVNLYFPLRVF